ncbi:MAG TPA: TetR/AcrR family transcriptional regulator [Solirubrobacteraceae bacterium]|jgi:AcrR family transcriptional regulator|nr:TetR/AcrR family transcriptional regulator [Solirubrobacteraceae bacterium]
MQPVGGDAHTRTFIETARRAQIVAAAIDAIAEVGFARASFAHIASRLGISRGLISYHFAGKDDLIAQVVTEVLEQGRAYMRTRILAQASTGPGFLRAYIESNLAFMREHPNYLVAIVEIARGGLTVDGGQRFFRGLDVDEAVRILEQHLARFQAQGELRPDFDPRAIAVAIRAAIDAVPRRIAHDPDLDIDSYAREIATVFDLATRPNP